MIIVRIMDCRKISKLVLILEVRRELKEARYISLRTNISVIKFARQSGKTTSVQTGSGAHNCIVAYTWS